MNKQNIAIIHPGAMGVAVASALKTSGSRVIWASEHRSKHSQARANQANLEDLVNLEKLVAQSDIIFSVCPPSSAKDVAQSIADLGFQGLYVDANAVSPSSTLEVAGIVENTGASFIDGSIIGGPPKKKHATRLYFSGEKASHITPLFENSLFQTLALDGDVSAASALKMAYAAWTKGSSALLLNVRALAKATGVEDALLNEWDKSLPDLRARSERTAFIASQKAWRFTGEMNEIANSFATQGLTDDFHRAAEQVYETLSSFKNSETHSTQDVLDKLLEP